MLPALRRNTDNLHLALMLALTFSTGMIDAVGYLGLDRVFTGNMTGNVVILGMALTGADGLPVVGPIIALVLFLAGAATAGRVLRPFRRAGRAGRPPCSESSASYSRRERSHPCCSPPSDRTQ